MFYCYTNTTTYEGADKLLISYTCFICFRFCLMCSNLKSLGHCGAVHPSKNLGTAFCAVWNPRWKFKYKDLAEFGWPSEDWLMKIKHSIHIKGFRVVTSDDDVIPPLIFQHGIRVNTKEIHQVSGGDSAPEDAVVGRPKLGKNILRHATQAGEPSVDCQKISVTASSLTSGR